MFRHMKREVTPAGEPVGPGSQRGERAETRHGHGDDDVARGLGRVEIGGGDDERHAENDADSGEGGNDTPFAILGEQRARDDQREKAKGIDDPRCLRPHDGVEDAAERRLRLQVALVVPDRRRRARP